MTPKTFHRGLGFHPRRVDEAVGRAPTPRRFRAAVCGSFQRSMEGVRRAQAKLAHLGVEVLSPPDGNVESRRMGFTKLAGDPSNEPRLTEDRHLDAIRHADFVLLVAPDGKPGPSACFEVGFAKMAKVPVFSTNRIDDPTIKEYVTTVGRLEDIPDLARRRSKPAQTLLLQPDQALAEIRQQLLRIEGALQWAERPMNGQESAIVRQAVQRIVEFLGSLTENSSR